MCFTQRGGRAIDYFVVIERKSVALNTKQCGLFRHKTFFSALKIRLNFVTADAFTVLCQNSLHRTRKITFTRESIHFRYVNLLEYDEKSNAMDSIQPTTVTTKTTKTKIFLIFSRQCCVCCVYFQNQQYAKGARFSLKKRTVRFRSNGFLPLSLPIHLFPKWKIPTSIGSCERPFFCSLKVQTINSKKYEIKQRKNK